MTTIKIETIVDGSQYHLVVVVIVAVDDHILAAHDQVRIPGVDLVHHAEVGVVPPAVEILTDTEEIDVAVMTVITTIVVIIGIEVEEEFDFLEDLTAIVEVEVGEHMFQEEEGGETIDLMDLGIASLEIDSVIALPGQGLLVIVVIEGVILGLNQGPVL